MASLPPPTLADLNTLAASRYFLPAVATMAIYECLITLANEVDYVWKTGWTGASIVYYFNKYLFLVTYIGGIVGIAVPGASIELCVRGEVVGYILSLMPYVVIAAFSGMRMFALTGKNWILTWMVIILSIVPVPVNLITFHFGITAVTISPLGCVPIDRTPTNLGKHEVAITRTCLITADMMLIVATWATLHKRVELRDVYKGTLAAVLLRDGTIYFIGLLILNLLFLIFTYTSVDIMYGMNSSDFVVFIQALTSILLHRFLLHLQSANRRSLMYDSETTPGNNVRFTSIQFGDAEASQGSTLASEYELRNVKPGLGNASEGISEVLRVEETRR